MSAIMTQPAFILDWSIGSPRPGVDVTRTGVATYIDANGVIQSASDNTQRIDWSAGTPGLLIEDSRINVFRPSEDFSSGSWEKATAGDGVAPVVTVNQVIAPDGTLTADKIVFEVGTSAAANRSMLRQFRNVSGGSASISFWVKSAETNGANQVLSFTFGGSVVAGTITVTNQWQRVTRTGTGTNAYFGLELNGGQTTAKKSEVYIWGAQLELGANASSYIPTTTTAITRNADAATITGTNFSDWWQASKGGAGEGIGIYVVDEVARYSNLDFTAASNNVVGYKTAAYQGPATYVVGTANALPYLNSTSRLKSDSTFRYDGTKAEVLGPTANSEYFRAGNTTSGRGLRFSSFEVAGSWNVGHKIDAPGDGGTKGTLTFATNSVDRVTITDQGGFRFIGLASAPATPAAGMVYYDTGTNKLRCYNGTTWNDLF